MYLEPCFDGSLKKRKKYEISASCECVSFLLSVHNNNNVPDKQAIFGIQHLLIQNRFFLYHVSFLHMIWYQNI